MGNESRPKPPANNSPAIIPCRSPLLSAKATEVNFERVGDELNIVIQAESPAAAMAFPAALFVLCIWPVAVFGLTSIRVNAPANPVLVALFTAGAVVGLWGLISVARETRLPTLVRVWPGGVELDPQGKKHPVGFRLRRDEIVHIRIHPGTNGRRTMLQFFAIDGAIHCVSLMLPPGRLLDEFQGDLRQVLGMPVEDEG